MAAVPTRPTPSLTKGDSGWRMTVGPSAAFERPSDPLSGPGRGKRLYLRDTPSAPLRTGAGASPPLHTPYLIGLLKRRGR